MNCNKKYHKLTFNFYMKIKKITHLIAISTIALSSSFITTTSFAKSVEILNVSYDPTRELYDEYNKHFVKHWKEKTGDDLKINQSHGGSGKQARSVIDGLEADIVTLALAYDIDAISQKTGTINANWQAKLPNASSPYTSTIVFLVRKGNPLGIKDWNDIAKKGVKVITPNPKTSGGARWNYLAAWLYAEKQFGNDEAKIKAFVKQVFDNVAIYDTGARGSTITFAQRGIGDVLIAWENEALLTLKQFGSNKFEIITPSISVLAQPPVTVVDGFATKHGTQDIAKAYLSGLYTEEAQEIVAKNFYRPTNKAVAKKYENIFPKLTLISVDKLGGWEKVQKIHFDDNGTFDQITKK